MNRIRFFLSALLAVCLGLSPGLLLAGCAPSNNYVAGFKGPEYDVRTYGAIPDDGLDDTTAIQDAMNAATTLGGKVKIPPGTFHYTRLTIKPNVMLEGAGRFASFLICTDLSAGSSIKRNDVDEACFYVGFRDLAIATAVSNVAAAQATCPDLYGLNMAGVAYSVIENVTVSGFGEGGIVFAQADAGTEGLGFTTAVEDGNYNTVMNVNAGANGAYNTDALTHTSVVGTLTSGSPTFTLSAFEASQLRVGDAISGYGIPSSTTLSAVSTTTATLSANATATTLATTWTPLTAYLIGDVVRNGANLYVCDANGTSASGGGPTGTGSNITDVTAQWDYLGAAWTTSQPAAPGIYFKYKANSNKLYACYAKGGGGVNPIVINWGTDNLISGATAESVARGVWFGPSSSNNKVESIRAEGLSDAIIQASIGSSGNSVDTVHQSSSSIYTNIGNEAYARIVGGPFNSFTSGLKSHSSLSTTSDHNFADFLGWKTGRDGMAYLKVPGFSSGSATADAAPKLQFWNTIQATTTGMTLGEIQAYNTDNSGGAAGTNAVLRMKTFDASGRSGFSFLTGAGGAVSEVVEINTGLKIGGSGFSAQTASSYATVTPTSGVSVASAVSGEAALGLQTADGTRSRRAKLFVDDTNGVSGIFWTASSSTTPFVFNRAGTEIMRMDTSNNVGIGTAAATARLHVSKAAAAASGATGLLKLTPTADTAQTASTEIPNLHVDVGGIIRTWATGAITEQSEVKIEAPSYAAAGASVVSDAATVTIDAAPVASTNMTFTRSMALWVKAGLARFTGGLSIGDGTTITKVLSSTGTLDFPDTATSASSDLTITVTGAADGDVVQIATPNASVPAGAHNFRGWVSGANTVTIRFSNNSGSNLNPASGTFRAAVTQF